MAATEQPATFQPWAAPASGSFISICRLTAGEEEQPGPIVGAGHEGGVGLVHLDACPQALGLGGAGGGHALVQRQAQEALRVLHLAQDARHPI